jgi:hypothetical protein
MPMPPTMTAGVTQQGSSVDGLAWHILGQTYKPLQVSESSFAWHALLPPGTFVPPHIHPTQEEFIYVFEGRFDLLLDGQPSNASAGDLIRLPCSITRRPTSRACSGYHRHAVSGTCSRPSTTYLTQPRSFDWRPCTK